MSHSIYKVCCNDKDLRSKLYLCYFRINLTHTTFICA